MPTASALQVAIALSGASSRRVLPPVNGAHSADADPGRPPAPEPPSSDHLSIRVGPGPKAAQATGPGGQQKWPSGLSVVSCEVWGSVSCSCGPGKPPQQEAEVGKRPIVVLSEQERARLHTMIGRGVAPASALTHARILLKANQGEAGPGWTDAAIGAALEVSPDSVARVRMRYVAAGLEAAVSRKPPARSYRRRLDREEARLVALTCSAPPQGHKRWTLRLLADRLVELAVVESVSYETVRQALQQTSSRRG